MAHFAKISETKEVLAVNSVNDSDILNANGVEDETVGQQYLQETSNWPAEQWIQTSYNTNNNTHKNGGTPLRGNYAGIGFIWDSENQIFWGQKPHASWVKNISEARWQSSIGDAPTLTDEQELQNSSARFNENGDLTTPATHHWRYQWNEIGQTWDLTNTII